MNVAANPGAHICASAQVYPDSQPAEVPPRPTWIGADPRVAGGSAKIDPSEAGFEQQDSNLSICESDTGASKKSGKGKARVAKVTRRHPT